MYRIQESDLARASQLLARSFFQYPTFTYVIPDHTDRIHRLEHVFDFMLRLALRQGEVVAPSSAIEGVSIWLHSTKSGYSLGDVIRAGLLCLGSRIGARSLVRFVEVGTRKQKIRSRIVTEPHYRLDMIAVDPALQRGGFGRSMVEAKLREFDQAKAPCYLETSDRRNVAYYDRFGFRLIHQYRIATVDVFSLFRKANA